MELSAADRKVVFDNLAAMRREAAHLNGEILRLENAVRVKSESKIADEMDSMMPRCSTLQRLSEQIGDILGSRRQPPTGTGLRVLRITNVRVDGTP